MGHEALPTTNNLNWVSQFILVVCSNDLLNFVDGSDLCPIQYFPLLASKSTTDINIEYLLWQKKKKNQCILSWLNATLVEKVLSTLYGLTTTR